MSVLGGLAGGALAHILTSTAFHPLESQIAANFQPSDLAAKYKAWEDNPLIVPETAVLLEIANRNMARPGLALAACLNHGVNLGSGRSTRGFYRDTNELWEAARKLQLKIPEIDFWREGVRRGFIERTDADPRIIRAGGDPTWWFPFMEWEYDRPGVSDILDGYIRGRIGFADAERMLKETGSRLDIWLPTIDQRRPLPGLIELREAVNRGLMTPAQMTEILGYHGFDRDQFGPLYTELLKSLPGVADLVRFTARQLWAPELVGPYGLYDGFDERSRPWFRKLGLDYPLGFNIQVDGNQREATLPDLYWAASREILPLSMAIQAYQRLREDQVVRMQGEIPGLRPFTIDDLRFHLRVAGYPPPMQDFMIALSHQPLGQRQIQWGLQYGGKDRSWAFNRYLDTGLSIDNAGTVADIAEARNAARETAWIDSLVTKAKRDTVTEIEGLYDDGIIDRNTALRQLADAGLSASLSTHLLDLSDAKRARGLVRAAVSATGRDYLSGALSTAEAAAALQSYGLTAARAGELMQIWTIRRSRHRRQASTSQILKWVGTGRIDAAEGARRLANLDWSQPDVLLLLADAEGSLANLQARQRKLAESDAAKRARELERLAREAAAQGKRLVSEANRVAPRGVLTRWMIDGVISQDEYRQGMRDRGYPDNLIDDYIRDATTPKPPRPKVAPPIRPFPKPEGSAHPGLAVAKKWAKDGVIDRSQFEEMLHDLGYSRSDIDRFVADQYPAAP